MTQETGTVKESLKSKIVNHLKVNGLEVTEEAVKAFIPVFMGVMKIIVDDTKNPFDNMAYASLESTVEGLLEDLADKINPED